MQIGRRSRSDELLAAGKTLFHLDLTLHLAAHLNGNEMRLPVGNPKHARAAVDRSDGRLRDQNPELFDFPCVTSDVKATRAERSGRILSSASSNATLTRTVAFWRSAAGTI